MTVQERFWSKVEKTDWCWLWTAGTSSGYGTFWLTGRMRPAHQVAYELSVGKVPAGMQIDHLCRNTRCVNPDHLEAVSPRTNILRGTAPAALNARKTRCVNEHPLAGENLVVGGRGGRQCRICERERSRRSSRRYYARLRGGR